MADGRQRGHLQEQRKVFVIDLVHCWLLASPRH